MIRFAVRFRSGRLYQLSRNSDSLLRPTTNGHFGSASLAPLTFCVAMMLLRKTVQLGVSKDTESSDSLRKVLVRKVREMDVPVNWVNSELVVGKGR